MAMLLFDSKNEASIVHKPTYSFFKRIPAFFLDCFVLGILGLVLGLFFGRQFAAMGPWGRIVGFFIALFYFGLLNSSFGDGQTLGKKILKIRVADATGKSSSLAKSFLRAAILLMPVFLNGAFLPPSIVLSPIGGLVQFAIFGLGGAIVYLYLFNRRTRQSLHDVIVGTYVVPGDVNSPLTVVPVDKFHYAVIAAWMISVLVIPNIVGSQLRKKPVLQDISVTYRKLQESNDQYLLELMVGKTYGTWGNYRYLAVKALSKTEPSSYEMAVQNIAARVLSAYPRISEVDRLIVRVMYGYDIGIASTWKRQENNHTVSEWREKLKQ